MAQTAGYIHSNIVLSPGFFLSGSFKYPYFEIFFYKGLRVLEGFLGRDVKSPLNCGCEILHTDRSPGSIPDETCGVVEDAHVVLFGIKNIHDSVKLMIDEIPAPADAKRCGRLLGKTLSARLLFCHKKEYTREFFVPMRMKS